MGAIMSVNKAGSDYRAFGDSFDFFSKLGAVAVALSIILVCAAAHHHCAAATNSSTSLNSNLKGFYIATGTTAGLIGVRTLLYWKAKKAEASPLS